MSDQRTSVITETHSLLDAAAAQRIELMSQVASLDDVIHALRWKLIESEFGVTPGCLVKYGKDVFKINDRFKFFSSHNSRGEKPWLHGFRRKKDGTFENAARTLHRDWGPIE